jgi:hypothetical protein
MGKLTNLNPSKPLTEADMPPGMATDTELTAAEAALTAAQAAHLAAVDPHLQYATQARGDARYERLFASAFRATPTIGVFQTLPNNIETKISLNNEIEDTLNQYNAGLSRLTAIEAEMWRLAVNISFSLPTSGRLYLEFRKNNTAAPGLRLLDLTPNSGVFSMLITSFISLGAGDYLELFCNIAAANAVVAANFYSHWSGQRVK